MGCSKTLVLGTATCELDTCTTAAQVSVGTKWVLGTDFASDLCYCAVITNKNDYSEAYWNQYNPATNSLDLKATFPGDMGGTIAYDAQHQKFVTRNTLSSKIVIFDPVSNAVSTIDPGYGCGSFLYIPEKQRIYGTMGFVGGWVVGYIDMDLLTVVQLAAIPAYAGFFYQPYSWEYVPLNDCMYGGWINGFGQSALIKYDFASNTATHIMDAVPGGLYPISTRYDPDTSLLLACCNGYLNEINVLTNSIVNTTLVPGGSALYAGPYVSSLKKLFFTGWDNITGFGVIESYHTPDLAMARVLDDYDYIDQDGNRLLSFKDGSGLSFAADLVSGDNGIRRLCLT